MNRRISLLLACLLTLVLILGSPQAATAARLAAMPSGSPIGCLDSASVSDGRITVAGWTFDGDLIEETITIHIYIGAPAGSGTLLGAAVANTPRPDVESVFPGCGAAHGFSASFTTSFSGTQTVYVYAINAPGTAGGNTLIGSAKVTIPGPVNSFGNNPFGCCDSVSGGMGTVKVTGWAIDGDIPTAFADIQAYIGGPAGTGTLLGTTTASASRPDVGAAYPGVGDSHGFNTTFSTSRSGNQNVYVYALNLSGTPGVNKLLGSFTVNVREFPHGNPIGCADSVTVSGGTVSVSGWALDGDAVDKYVDIHAYIGGPAGQGILLGSTTANQPRPDVDEVFPGVGASHGFTASWNTDLYGSQTVYLYVINSQGTAGGNILLGTKTIKLRNSDLPTGNPAGCVDSITAEAGSVSVSGWAYDGDKPSGTVSIKVYIGGPAGTGTLLGTVLANGSRPDVNAAFPGCGNNHGFSATFSTVKTGTQTIYVYAINLSGTPGQDKLLRTVTVTFASDLQTELLRLVNEARVQNGLLPLTWSTSLGQSAEVRAREIVQLFSHTRPDGSEWYTVNPLVNGENIAAGYPSAQSVFDAWMDSPGHRANILRSYFTTMGSAYYYQSGTKYVHYWAQLFG